MVRQVCAEWAVNVDKIVGHMLGQHTEFLKGLVALALHKVHTGKENAVTHAVASSTEYTQRQIRFGADSAHAKHAKG